MNGTKYKRRAFCRVVFLALAVLATGGCSRIETVKVINRFDQPIRVRLGINKASPIIPARSEVIFEGKHYIGGRVRVMILSTAGKTLWEGVIDPTGDSAFRSIAIIEVKP
jgi:hypothetical protein